MPYNFRRVLRNREGLGLGLGPLSVYYMSCLSPFTCRLAELMDEHKEELATLESVDSGAVYTLALKTHVGFSIDTFRYFAGWCDKIQGKTIPINNARPSANLCFTKREPIGYDRV